MYVPERKTYICDDTPFPIKCSSFRYLYWLFLNNNKISCVCVFLSQVNFSLSCFCIIFVFLRFSDILSCTMRTAHTRHKRAHLCKWASLMLVWNCGLFLSFFRVCFCIYGVVYWFCWREKIRKGILNINEVNYFSCIMYFPEFDGGNGWFFINNLSR